MNDLITGIGRDVVIEYMHTEQPELTVFDGSSQEQLFVLKKGRYSTKQAVILFPAGYIPYSVTAEKKSVRVRFYFRKRGLQFNSVLQIKNENAAIGIAEAFEKMSDEQLSDASLYRGSLVYAESKGRKSIVPCVSTAAFPLFHPFIWRSMKIENETLFFFLLDEYTFLRQAVLPPVVEELLVSTRKMLYVPGRRIPQKTPFAYDACITASDLQPLQPDMLAQVKKELQTLTDSVFIPAGSGQKPLIVSIQKDFYTYVHVEDFHKKTAAQLVNLIPAAYLSQHTKENGSVKDRVPPVDLLYITDDMICFGFDGSALSFVPEQTYSVSLQIGIRSISAEFVVQNVLSTGGKSAAVCAVTSVKPEDRRFLYEKQYGITLR